MSTFTLNDNLLPIVCFTQQKHPFSTIEKGCLTASLHKNNTDIYFISSLNHQRQAFFFLSFLEFHALYHTNKRTDLVFYKSCCNGIWC